MSLFLTYILYINTLHNLICPFIWNLPSCKVWIKYYAFQENIVRMGGTPSYFGKLYLWKLFLVALYFINLWPFLIPNQESNPLGITIFSIGMCFLPALYLWLLNYEPWWIINIAPIKHKISFILSQNSTIFWRKYFEQNLVNLIS